MFGAVPDWWLSANGPGAICLNPRKQPTRAPSGMPGPRLLLPEVSTASGSNKDSRSMRVRYRRVQVRLAPG